MHNRGLAQNRLMSSTVTCTKYTANEEQLLQNVLSVQYEKEIKFLLSFQYHIRNSDVLKTFINKEICTINPEEKNEI